MKAVIAALAANLGIAIAKFAAFLVTGSASMLAEAVHSVADTGNEVLLLIGSGRSRRARTERAPVRVRPGAVLLRVRGRGDAVHRRRGLLASTTACTRSSRPRRLRVAGGRVRRARPVGGARGVLAAHRDPGGEQGARRGAAGGRSCTPPRRRSCPSCCSRTWPRCSASGFAFLGVLLSQLTGNDAVGRRGSVAVGVLLACAAFIVGYETKSLLIGESASAEVSAADRAGAGGRPRGVPGDPPADLAHRPGLAAGGREDRRCPRS